MERDLREARSRYEQIMRAQYVHAQRHSWQSLIEGGNPNELARTAAELRYLSLAQQEAAKALTQKQTQIDTVEKETRARRAELSRIAREEEENHAKLLDEKRDRQAAVKKLAREIATQQAAIEKLKKRPDSIGKSRRFNRQTTRTRARSRRSYRSRRRGQTRGGCPKESKAHAPLPSGSFAQSKGRLSARYSGRVAAGFGSRRTGSAVWQGILFSAPEGAEVSACAAGRVVFSDWLRGYGNLLIIDHGGTYMSVYANNESVLKNVGDQGHRRRNHFHRWHIWCER